MKKIIILLILQFILVGCSKQISTAKVSENKTETVSVDHQIINLKQYFKDTSDSVFYFVYLVDNDNIIFRRTINEPNQYIDEIYNYDRQTEKVQKIIENSVDEQFIPRFYSDGTLYLSKENYMDDKNLTEIFAYKNEELNRILEQDYFISSIVYFGMFDEQLSLIMNNTNKHYESVLTVYNLENNSHYDITFPEDEIIKTSVFNNSIIFSSTDGVYTYQNKTMSNFNKTNHEVTIENDFFTVKGNIVPHYQDDFISVEQENQKIKIEESYIVGTLQNNILITEKTESHLFKENFQTYDDFIWQASDHHYEITYFNGDNIVTKKLYDEEFFRGLEFVTTRENTMYVADPSGLLYVITISLN